jgi:carboxymethylenebutenolidase
MQERTLDLRTAAGTMEVFIAQPEGKGPFPPVVLYMDMWGIREELRDLACRVATSGYTCLLPDLYYRWGKVRNSFKNEQGQMLSFANLATEKQEFVLGAMRKLSDAMVIEDTAELLAFMDGDKTIRPGPVGSIGYCMGGRHVLCIAGKFPSRFRANACLHGVEIVTDKPDSPHRLAMAAEGELYCGHAERDKFTQPEVITALEEALKGRKMHFFYEVHKGAEHGYALPDRDVHDKHAFNRDWELILRMFHDQLHPYQ